MSLGQPNIKSPDQENNRPNSREEKQAEQIKESLGSVFVDTLIRNASKADEGNNGIILKLKLGDVSAEFKEALSERGVDVSDDQAVKMLKMYDEGIAKREMKMQQKAKQIIEDNAGEPHAQVPAANLYQNIELTDKEKEIIEKRTDYPMLGNKAEFILMDYIDGDDLYTKLIKKVAKLNNPGSHLADDLDNEQFKKIEEFVQQRLNYKDPAGARDDGEAESQKRRVFNDNESKLWNALKKKQVQGQEQLFEQLDNAISTLHDAGYIHRDLHERNIMVKGDPFSEDSKIQTFLIDFAEMAMYNGEEITVNDYRDKEGDRFVQDKSAINRFRKYCLEDHQDNVNIGAGPIARID